MNPSSFILLCSTQIILNKSLRTLLISIAKKKKKDYFFLLMVCPRVMQESLSYSKKQNGDLDYSAFTIWFSEENSTGRCLSPSQFCRQCNMS